MKGLRRGQQDQFSRLPPSLKRAGRRSRWPTSRSSVPNSGNLAILVDGKNISAVQTQAEPIAVYARRPWHRGDMGRGLKNPAQRPARSCCASFPDGPFERCGSPIRILSKSLFWLTGSTSVFRENPHHQPEFRQGAGRQRGPGDRDGGSRQPRCWVSASASKAMPIWRQFTPIRSCAGVKPGDLSVGIVSPPDISISFLKARAIGHARPIRLFSKRQVLFTTMTAVRFALSSTALPAN